ncbi:MAG: O-antigen ligase family protein [Elusimicrobia bacterium]|nr:O-antigen ligase family protein [Elusimicrobiota bacterium]
MLSFFKRSDRGLLALFFCLFFLNGGRGAFSLLFYQTASLILFAFSRSELRGKKSGLEVPLLCLFIFCGLSALSLAFKQWDGIAQWTTLAAHILNFYHFLQIEEETFTDNFLNSLFILSSFYSAFYVTAVVLKLHTPHLLPNENLVFSFLNCGLIAALGRWLEEKKSFSFLFLGCMILIITAQLFLFSRGGFLSLAAGLSLFLLWNWKKALPSVGSIVLFIALAILIIPGRSQMITSKFISFQEYTRWTIWQGSFHAFLAKPILGWGLGSFEHAYQQKKLPLESEIGRYAKTTRFAHNEFLDAAVQTGTIGLILIGWILLKIFLDGFSRLKDTKQSGWKPVTLFVSWIMLLTQCLVDFNLHLPILAFLFLFYSANLLRPQPDGEWTLIPRMVWKYLLTVWLVVTSIIGLTHAAVFVADICQSKGAAERASSFYQMAVNLNPADSKSVEKLVSLLPPKESENLLRKATRWNQWNDRLHLQLARSCLVQKKYAEAAQAYQAAIFNNPKFPFYYGELAEIYLFNGQTEAGLSLYQKAVQLEPFYTLAHYRIGQIYSEKGNSKIAQKWFDNVTKISNNHLQPENDYEQRLIALSSK